MSAAALLDRVRAVLAKDLASTGWPDLRDLLTELTEALERHRAWVADLQSGMYVNCVYCGHRYGPGETTPVSMADALKAHVAQCPQHPLAEAVAALEGAAHALRSFQHGNSSREFARDQAERLDAVVAGLRQPGGGR